jgi:hypothetical protein
VKLCYFYLLKNSNYNIAPYFLYITYFKEKNQNFFRFLILNFYTFLYLFYESINFATKNVKTKIQEKEIVSKKIKENYNFIRYYRKINYTRTPQNYNLDSKHRINETRIL